MNCDSWDVPKNSLIAATTGRMLISVCGVIASTSWVVIRSRTTRSMRAQTDAHLVLDQLADRPDAPVGEVVLVVEPVAGLLLDEVQHVGDRRQHLAAAEHVLVLVGQVELLVGQPEQLTEPGDFGAQLAVQLVATDPAEVVAAALEEGIAEVGPGRLDGRRLARTGPLVDLDEGLVLGRGDVALLVPLALEEVEVSDEAVEEARSVLLVVAEGAQQGEDAEAALAGDAGAGRDVTAGLLLDVELHPLAAVRGGSCPSPAGAW